MNIFGKLPEVSEPSEERVCVPLKGGNMQHKENILIGLAELGALKFQRLRLLILTGAKDTEIMESLNKISGVVSEMKIYIDSFQRDV